MGIERRKRRETGGKEIVRGGEGLERYLGCLLLSLFQALAIPEKVREDWIQPNLTVVRC
jgi:hypothetical protein